MMAAAGVLMGIGAPAVAQGASGPTRVIENGESAAASSRADAGVPNDAIKRAAFSIDISPSLSSDGDGTVTSSPAGVNCTLTAPVRTSGTCRATFADGVTVTLTATPAASSTFVRWNNVGSACGTLPTCQLTPTANITVGPIFDPLVRYPLTIVGAGIGAGHIEGIEGAIYIGTVDLHCTSTLGVMTGVCTTQYVPGKLIELQLGDQEEPGFLSLGPPCTDSFFCKGIMPAAPTTIVANWRGFGFQVAGAGAGSGRVTSTGSTSLDCAVASTNATGRCQEPYLRRISPPAAVSLTAIPAPGSRFVGFSGKCVSSTTTCQFTPTLPPDFPLTFPPVTATFALETTVTRDLGVSASLNSDGDGTVTSSPAGINCALVSPLRKSGTCSAAFADGQVVTLTATPAASSTFKRWDVVGGPTCGTSPTCQVTLTANTTVIPVFDPAVRYPLTIIGAGGGAGHVEGVRNAGFVGIPDIHCTSVVGVTSGVCTTQYAPGKVIELHAGDQDEPSFMSLGAPCTSSAFCNAIMPAAPTMIVVTWRGFGFQVAGAGTGSGRVTTTGSTALDCAVTSASATGKCQEVYQNRFFPGAVTLTAIPAPGSRFVGFSGKCVSATTACQFTPSVPADFPSSLPAVTATFMLEPAAPAALTVSGVGTGSGTVTSTPSGVSCAINAGTASGTCAPSFPAGTAVTLLAAPNAGSAFAGWTGACSGTGDCSITLGEPKSVTAQFAAILPSIAVSGTGSGSVSSSPSGLACTIASGTPSGTCNAAFNSGTAVTLTATPAAGWTFAGWGGDCTGTGTCQPNVTANRAVVANFARVTLALKITGAGTGDGIVKAPAVGLNCVVAKGVGKDPDCTTLVAQDAAVTLTADPQGGSVFAGWSGDGCSGAALTCALTISQARNVVAQFRAPKAARDIAQSMLAGTALPADEALELDRFGNKDGKLNLGDLLALLDRTGERLAPATTQALIGAERPVGGLTPAPATRRTP